jgi:quercetin dioxygenase-like cupin family protein
MKTVRWFALAAGVNLLATAPASMLGPATAFATSAAGVDAVTISQSTVDGKDYITREITIQPGGSTGWHYHDGEVFGVIREGTLTHDTADCTVDGIYPAGAPITEASGPDHVHIGRNLEPVPLVMWVTYIDAAGAPLSVDAPDPGCGFA